MYVLTVLGLLITTERIFFQGPKLWNSLPSFLIGPCSLSLIPIENLSISSKSKPRLYVIRLSSSYN